VETETEWIAFARGRSFRELESEVEDALKKGRKLPRKDGFGLPGVKVRMVFELSPEENEVAEKALLKVGDEVSERLGGEPIEPKEAFLMAMKLILESDPASGTHPERVEKEHSIYSVLYHLCPGCRTARLMTSEGPVEVPAASVERVEDGARREAIRPDEEVLAGEAASAAAEPVKIDRPNPPSLLRKLRLRDAGRCSNPFCRRTRDLQGHHLHARSEGGPTTLGNEALFCKYCHSLIELGYLEVRGNPVAGLVFITRADRLELGLEADAESLSKIPVVQAPAAAPAPTAAFTRVNGESESPKGVELVFARVAQALRRLGCSQEEARERLGRVRETLRGAEKLPEEGDVLREALARARRDA